MIVTMSVTSFHTPTSWVFELTSTATVVRAGGGPITAHCVNLVQAEEPGRHPQNLTPKTI